MHLLVPFSEIPERGVQFEIPGISWFPDELLDGSGPVAADVQLVSKQKCKVEAQGKLEAVIRLCCDRCLQNYKYVISSSFTFIVELPDKEHSWRLHDLECDADDLDTIQVDEPVVDLGDMMRQQVYLSIPEKRLCGKQCKGLCRSCGANLNIDQCDCTTEKVNSPFAVLASLKKQEID